MDDEQKQKFMEWLHTTERVYRVDLEKAWEACLETNKTEEEPEPSPTEMVKRLLEKGWTVEAYPDTDMTFFRSPDGKNRLALIAAYHQVFPRKKKVEVEVWLDSDREVRIIPSNSDSKGLDPKRVSWGWTKGVATFLYLGGGITMFGGWFILTASISIAVIAFYFLLVLGSEEKDDERNK